MDTFKTLKYRIPISLYSLYLLSNSGHSLREFLWSECSETMEPPPTTSEQPNCSRTLQGITCSIFGDVSLYLANQRIHRHHQQLTLGMESTERPEPGMIGGRTSYCCPEAIPAKPT